MTRKIIDEKRLCHAIDCTNLGEWNKKENGKIYRSRWCSSCKKRLIGVPLKDRINVDKYRECEYCRWHGPCDTHRPLSAENGGTYKKGNVRSICPNCHRLINYKLINDKFLFINEKL